MEKVRGSFPDNLDYIEKGEPPGSFARKTAGEMRVIEPYWYNCLYGLIRLIFPPPGDSPDIRLTNQVIEAEIFVMPKAVFVRNPPELFRYPGQYDDLRVLRFLVSRLLEMASSGATSKRRDEDRLVKGEVREYECEDFVGKVGYRTFMACSLRNSLGASKPDAMHGLTGR
jgi:hypothetical protein